MYVLETSYLVGNILSYFTTSLAPCCTINFGIALYGFQWYNYLSLYLIFMISHSISVTCSCTDEYLIVVSIYFNVSSIGLNSGSKCILWICNPNLFYILNVLSNALFNILIFISVIYFIRMNSIVLDMVTRNIYPWIYMIYAQSLFFYVYH